MWRYWKIHIGYKINVLVLNHWSNLIYVETLVKSDLCWITAQIWSLMNHWSNLICVEPLVKSDRYSQTYWLPPHLTDLPMTVFKESYSQVMHITCIAKSDERLLYLALCWQSHNYIHQRGTFDSCNRYMNFTSKKMHCLYFYASSKLWPPISGHCISIFQDTAVMAWSD